MEVSHLRNAGGSLCRAALSEAPSVRWRRVHGVCGRPVRRVSLGLDDLFAGLSDEEDPTGVAGYTNSLPSCSTRPPEILCSENMPNLAAHPLSIALA